MLHHEITPPAIVQAIEQAINARWQKLLAEMAPKLATEIYKGLAEQGHTELYVPKDKPRSRVQQAMPEIERMLAEGKTAGQIRTRLKLSRTVVYDAIAKIKKSSAAAG